MLEVAYDYIRRLKVIRNVTGGLNKKCVTYDYAETGEMKSKTLYNDLGVIVSTVNYKYNIRGWTTEINAGEKFKEFLAYSGKSSYTGNISATTYDYNLTTTQNGAKRLGYTQAYSYDELNRLTEVNVLQQSPISGKNFGDSLTETLSYDANGRITVKQRGQSSAKWDYAYKNGTNKLVSVKGYHGADTNYVYDQYGNMTRDYSKRMEVTYDYRNLPIKFEFWQTVADMDSEIAASTVDMVYDAGGNRVLKTERLPNGSKSKLYSGGFTYKAESADEFETHFDYKLAYYNMPGGEGRANLKDDGSVEKSYVYLKDHLGSTRMTLDDQSEVVESDVFTAYGEELQLEDGGDQETAEKFTGKELAEG